jgi:hypothetical protein
MVKWRTGRMWAELVCSPLPGSGCHTIWAAGPCAVDRRRWSPDHRGGRGTARRPGCVPRDCVTPPRCGRGGVTQSFSCHSGALQSRAAGSGEDTGSSTGHTGHRSTTASIIRRRPESPCSHLSGLGATRPKRSCFSIGVRGPQAPSMATFRIKVRSRRVQGPGRGLLAPRGSGQPATRRFVPFAAFLAAGLPG